jgi:uncharacterized protein
MENFTPFSAFLGGTLIGLAATILLASNGRIAGVSGILGGVLQGGGEVAWRVAFLGGLVLGTLAVRLVGGDSVSVSLQAPAWGLVVAGLLVGYGTRLGSGCTSGHGVCGIARLSPRSLAATLTFMATGFATVYVVRHVIGG